MKLRTTLRKLTAWLALVLAMAVPAQAEGFSAIVTSNGMTVYADAGRRVALGTLPVTTIVQVEAYSGDTAYISLNGRYGFAEVSRMTALSSLAKPAVFNTYSRVYQYPNLSSRWMSIAPGLRVNLLAVNGPWAMVECNGVVAYTNKDHVTLEAAQAPSVDAGSPSPAVDSIVAETFPATVSLNGAPVFASSAESSRCLGFLYSGIQVTVHAYNGQWAYVELNGNFGFMRLTDLTRASAPAPAAPVQPETPLSVVESLQNAGYSTEQIIYLFLTQQMGLNTAVACGILANVERECSFRVTAASYDGGYGIVQWTGVRNTRLKNWCNENGYDYTTLEGQLWYLKYELEVHHPKTLKYLQSVENTEVGAYDAAHYFCYNFEIPANRAARSVERGKLARDKYWVRYATI